MVPSYLWLLEATHEALTEVIVGVHLSSCLIGCVILKVSSSVQEIVRCAH